MSSPSWTMVVEIGARLDPEPPDDREAIGCPWCERLEAERILTGSDRLTGDTGFEVHRCLGCGLAYTKPRPSAAAMVRYYTDGYYAALSPASSPGRSAMAAAGLAAVFGYPGVGPRFPCLGPVSAMLSRLAGRDASHVPHVPGGRLVDVGAGRGAVLAAYLALGWSGVGVEPDGRASAAGRAAGLDVRTGTLEDQAFQRDSFDAAVLNHVLEHVPRPRALLRELARVLRPGAWLLIRVPNAGSWEARVFGPHWPPWELPRHLLHFTRSSLHMMLEESGFQVVRSRAEFRPGHTGLNTAYAFRHGLGVEVPARLPATLLAPLCLASSWAGRSSDLALLARLAGSDVNRGGSPPSPSSAYER